MTAGNRQKNMLKLNWSEILDFCGHKY